MSQQENNPNDPILSNHSKELNNKLDSMGGAKDTKKKSDPYKVLLGVTLVSLVVYGVLFYLFINRKLRVETLLTLISIKFILTSGWTYWMRFREKKSRR